jgi:ADP-ribosylglycohydrolase
MNSSTILNIIRGVAICDALGFPVQFNPREFRTTDPVVDMGKLRSGCIEPGLWSDDTSLTLCLAESLLNGFDLKYQSGVFK